MAKNVTVERMLYIYIFLKEHVFIICSLGKCRDQALIGVFLLLFQIMF